MEGTELWQRVVADIVRRWTSHARPGDDGSARPKPGSRPEHYELVLWDTGFDDVASYESAEGHGWTIETIIGNLYSTSFCSKNILGDNAEAFQADLSAVLLAHDPSGTYHETMRFGYTIGRKPA